MFNTGQVTLPKAWRDKQKTKKFVAEETAGGLLIKPLEKDETVFYETDDGFGLYCEGGLDLDKFAAAINQVEEEEKNEKLSKNSKKA